MKPHRCARFKQTGSMRLMAANISITRDGERKEQSISADTMLLKCVRCGKTHQVDSQVVETKGRFRTLKAGVDLGGNGEAAAI